MHYIDAPSAHKLFSYPELTQLLLQAHQTSAEIIEDLLLESNSGHSTDQFFLRAAWQKDHYLGVKNTTIFPENYRRGKLPSIQALYTLFDGNNGSPLCCIDGTALTHIKTATDSALACDLLARKDVKVMLMIGAGAMAPHLIKAHYAVRPSIETILIFNRTPERCWQIAEQLAVENISIVPVTKLNRAIKEADLICSAVTSKEPYIKGKSLKPGVHVDLVGSFTEDLREADNETIRRGTLFVDSKKISLNKVGEILQPIEQGVITVNDIKADFYDVIKHDSFHRLHSDEITVFKNSGGGHLDLMMAQILYLKFIQDYSNE